MGVFASVALAFRYPTPGSSAALTAEVRGIPVGAVRSKMERFVRAVGQLELGEWEELHTRTLDLSPMFVPYVGHVVWGENYRRGEFMAALKGEQRELGVDLGGELPDHLEPILRYLDVTDKPLEDLIDVLGQAVATMTADLEKADPDNPYRHLLAAVAAAVSESLTEGARV